MSATLTRDLSRELSAALYEKIASDSPGQFKEAVDAVNEYTRLKVREDSFMERIMPSEHLPDSQIDRQVTTDKPIKIVDMEMESPAAVSVPFGAQPMTTYIWGRRYIVSFDRIMTNKFTKDVSDLRTYHMDIRQVISDNAIKDMLAEKDGKFMVAVDTALSGANVVLPTSGVAQYKTIAGKITRESLWDADKIIPSTPSNLEAHTYLVNNITIKDVCKAGFDEFGGGDISADIMKNGWTLQDFMGKRWIVTIKKALVPTNHMYQFCDPKFTGKHYSLEDTTLFVKKESFMIEFYAYSESGATIANVNALGHAHFV